MIIKLFWLNLLIGPIKAIPLITDLIVALYMTYFWIQWPLPPPHTHTSQ